MASNSLTRNKITKTRLQEATEQQRAEEEIRQIVESERQKIMFAPRNVIGPRDTIVDSNLQIIKKEVIVTETPSVKQELEEVEENYTGSEENSVNWTLLDPKLEAGDSFVVKVEETIDLNESTFTEQLDETFEAVVDNLYGTSVEHIMPLPENECFTSDPENGKFSQNYIKLLNMLNDQKDKEISLLMDLIKELQSNDLDPKSSNNKSDNKSINTENTQSSNTSAKSGLVVGNAQLVSQLTFDINGKDAKIKILYLEMLKLQDEIIRESDNIPPHANKTSHSPDDSTRSGNLPCSSKVIRQSTRLAVKKMVKKKVKEEATLLVSPKPKTASAVSPKSKATPAVSPKPKARNKPKPKRKYDVRYVPKFATSRWIDNNEEEEAILYECRICFQRITAAERDHHRTTHNQQERKRLKTRNKTSKNWYIKNN